MSAFAQPGMAVNKKAENHAVTKNAATSTLAHPINEVSHAPIEDRLHLNIRAMALAASATGTTIAGHLTAACVN